MSPAQTPAMYNTSFFHAEFVGKRYICRIPAEFPLEKVLEPAFWMHVGERLARWDQIEIRPDDATYIAELVVIDAGPLFAKVALRSQVKLTAQSDDPAKLEIELVGTKFRVKRGAAVLKDELSSKKEAQRWIEDYTSKAA